MLATKGTVIHLGSLGYSKTTEYNPNNETRRQVLARPNQEFISIDIVEHTPDLPNWNHIQASFSDGLKSQLPNSARRISAILSLGYYGKGGVDKVSKVEFETNEAIAAAHKVLIPGKKLEVIVMHDHAKNLILNALRQYFDNGNIQVKEIPPGKAAHTPALREYPNTQGWRIIAKK
ncbi:MAG: hypothetical protein V1708_04525 [Candidatus Micrarchaeota archaeon]